MTKEVLSEFAELIRENKRSPYSGSLRTGVDLGTASIVITVTDENNRPVAGATAASKVVKDGIAVDFISAMQTVRRLKAQLEGLLGVTLETAATAVPPGIMNGNVKYISNVVEGAGFEVINVTDEPTAAASVLEITDGAVVDVGGGATGIGILKDGKVIFTADEPTGGTHMTLVLAGYYGIPIEEAEKLKKDKDKGNDAFPIIRPVVEKMASIIKRFLPGYDVDCVYVVDGASYFDEFEQTFEKALGITTVKTNDALLVTPLGIAWNAAAGCVQIKEGMMRLDMDIKVIEQLVEQALGEIKAEQPLKFATPKLERYGMFKTIGEVIAASEEAQKKLLLSKISDRQKYVDVIRLAIIKRENLELISRLSVEKTEIDDYEHKLIKNRLAIEKAPGTKDLLTEAITDDNSLTLVEYCPLRVIDAITPTTNPTETIINNSISMIAGGNTVVFSPHPRAKKVSQTTVKMLNKALIDNGVPPNLITMVEELSIENINKMIDSPNVRLLVATGGPSIVKKVPSFGKRAIGAGAGNPPVAVDETTDIDKATKDIVDGCNFDNNVPCIAGKEVFAVDSICDYLIHHVKGNGAHQITDPILLEQLVALVTMEKGGPETSFVGKSARYILNKLGITVDVSVKVIIMEAPRDHLLVQEEMMMPILPVVRVSDADTAIEYAHQTEHGNRHTAMMYSKNVEKLSKMVKIMEATILVKNASSYAGIGVGGEGYTTFTIVGPIGEGLTSPRTLYRKRKCVMADAFSIR